MNKYWCNENFGICYPLLKEVDISKPIKEQLNYNNAYGRYWKTPVVEIKGKQYIMCSQWFKQFRDKLDKWVQKQNCKKKKKVQDVHMRSKERCMHYDFKKNQCMCTESAVFTQQCENITLEVRIDNHIAISLYEKFQFKKIAIRKNYYRTKDAWLMERKI